MSQFESAQRVAAVTPSDATNLATVAEALWIGVAGTISFVPDDPSNASGGAAVATNVNAGLFPVRCRRVNATGTTATGILALY